MIYKTFNADSAVTYCLQAIEPFFRSLLNSEMPEARQIQPRNRSKQALQSEFEFGGRRREALLGTSPKHQIALKRLRDSLGLGPGPSRNRPRLIKIAAAEPKKRLLGPDMRRAGPA
jgi:hypothetical protein